MEGKFSLEKRGVFTRRGGPPSSSTLTVTLYGCQPPRLIVISAISPSVRRISAARTWGTGYTLLVPAGVFFDGMVIALWCLRTPGEVGGG